MWETMTETLDYHRRKWYICEEGQWRPARIAEVYAFFASLGLQDFQEIMKLFRYRDSEAMARRYGKRNLFEEEAQQAFKGF